MGKGMARACAIIVAGGSGTRFGNPDGKLLIDVAGKPLITWTRSRRSMPRSGSGASSWCARLRRRMRCAAWP